MNRPVYVRAIRRSAEGAPALPRRLARYLAPIGIDAVRAALLDWPADRDPESVGLFTACGPSRFDAAALGEKMRGIDKNGELWRGGLEHLDPFALLKLMSCDVLSVLSMALPARGRSAHLCDDALGGIAALDDARGAIAQGALDDAVVVAFDDLSSDHALAELAGRAAIMPRQIAILHLSASSIGARACLAAIAVTRDGRDGAVGGAAALAALCDGVERVERSPVAIEISVDRGGAVVTLQPIEALPSSR